MLHWVFYFKAQPLMRYHSQISLVIATCFMVTYYNPPTYSIFFTLAPNYVSNTIQGQFCQRGKFLIVIVLSFGMIGIRFVRFLI